MTKFYRYFVLAVIVLYVLCPVDAAPGPVDDLLVILLGTVTGSKLQKI